MRTPAPLPNGPKLNATIDRAVETCRQLGMFGRGFLEKTLLEQVIILPPSAECLEVRHRSQLECISCRLECHLASPHA